jgi:prepilin-type N-terminal cleavage/methylation domain-containing protein
MRTNGFTLIEVLIVIAIFALIILVAAPLSGYWVRDANRLEVEGQLTQAIGRAKAAALRNYMAATGENPVTAICLSATNLLTVREGTAGVAPDCDPAAGTQLWQAQLSEHVAVQAGGAALSCLCFTNKGLLTGTSTCNTCSTTTSFTLTAGGEPTSLVLY